MRQRRDRNVEPAEVAFGSDDPQAPLKPTVVHHGILQCLEELATAILVDPLKPSFPGGFKQRLTGDLCPTVVEVGHHRVANQASHASGAVGDKAANLSCLIVRFGNFDHHEDGIARFCRLQPTLQIKCPHDRSGLERERPSSLDTLPGLVDQFVEKKRLAGICKQIDQRHPRSVLRGESQKVCTFVIGQSDRVVRVHDNKTERNRRDHRRNDVGGDGRRGGE